MKFLYLFRNLKQYKHPGLLMITKVVKQSRLYYIQNQVFITFFLHEIFIFRNLKQYKHPRWDPRRHWSPRRPSCPPLVKYDTVVSWALQNIYFIYVRHFWTLNLILCHLVWRTQEELQFFHKVCLRICANLPWEWLLKLQVVFKEDYLIFTYQDLIIFALIFVYIKLSRLHKL